MKALITGITGFVGSHLAEYLLSKGYEVYGTRRWRSRMENIEHILDKIKLVEADLNDAHSIENAIKQIKPDYIFHLAGQSFVPTSWHAPQETVKTNVIGTLNLLEAVRKYSSESKIQIAGSSEEYGLVHENETPIKETNELRPLSPYGVSKVGEDRISYQYAQSYGLKIIVTRAFNHTGPRRGEVFVCSDFAKQIVQIERGLKEPVIHVGNLEAKRDFSDVRDVVKAYEVVLQKGDFGDVYNICSGKAYSIKYVLDTLLTMTDAKIEIKQDPDKMRPSDVPILLGDCTKFKNKTGWEPTIPFEQTLKDTLNYWRERIK